MQSHLFFARLIDSRGFHLSLTFSFGLFLRYTARGWPTIDKVATVFIVERWLRNIIRRDYHRYFLPGLHLACIVRIFSIRRDAIIATVRKLCNKGRDTCVARGSTGHRLIISTGAYVCQVSFVHALDSSDVKVTFLWAQPRRNR